MTNTHTNTDPFTVTVPRLGSVWMMKTAAGETRARVVTIGGAVGFSDLDELCVAVEYDGIADEYGLTLGEFWELARPVEGVNHARRAN